MTYAWYFIIIMLLQPSFKYNDLSRVEECQLQLYDVVEELNDCYGRSADMQDSMEHNSANVAFLEEQIALLQRKLKSKENAQYALNEEIKTVQCVINFGAAVKPGLCLR